MHKQKPHPRLSPHQLQIRRELIHDMAPHVARLGVPGLSLNALGKLIDHRSPRSLQILFGDIGTMICLFQDWLCEVINDCVLDTLQACEGMPPSDQIAFFITELFPRLDEIKEIVIVATDSGPSSYQQPSAHAVRTLIPHLFECRKSVLSWTSAMIPEVPNSGPRERRIQNEIFFEIGYGAIAKSYRSTCATRYQEGRRPPVDREKSNYAIQFLTHTFELLTSPRADRRAR